MRTYQWKNLQHGLLMDIKPSGPYYDEDTSISDGVFSSEEEAFNAMDNYAKNESIIGMDFVLICTYVSNNQGR